MRADQRGCSVVLASAAAGQQVPNPEGPRQIQVLRGAQQLDEAEVLVDEVQVRSECVVSSVAAGVVQHLDPASWVSLVHTGQHLDEGGLARPVLTDDGEDLAPMQIERDVVERLGAGECLGDPLHAEQGRPLPRRSGLRYGHREANRLAMLG